MTRRKRCRTPTPPTVRRRSPGPPPAASRAPTSRGGQKTTLESYAAELLEDGHSAKKIAAALKRSLKFGGTVAEQLAGGVCMNKRSNKWCASQLCFLPQAQGPACETLNQDQCEAAEFCAAASSGLEFNEQGKLLLKTKCTAVKSRCEKNSCQKQCKLACGAC
jgi:hypothetical protein